MEVAYKEYTREVGYKVGDSIFAFPDGTVIQDIHYDTREGTRSLKRVRLGTSNG